MMDSAHTNKRASGRPSLLTEVEEQRYVTLRNWNFSQRAAGALARNLPRGRNGARSPLSASVCQRLDKLHGPFAETLKLPSGHSEESLRKLPAPALAALADARGDVSNRKYQEAAGLRPLVKRAKRAKKPLPVAGEQPAQAIPRAVLPEESITFRAWNRAQFIALSVSIVTARTQTTQLKNMRKWCSEYSSPVVLDANARQQLTPWEQIAATWDGEFIADAARATLQLPFRKITPASREAILAARNAMHSERPQSIRGLALQPPDSDDDEREAELIEIPAGLSGKAAAAMRAKVRAERQAVKRIMRWAGDDAGEWQAGPFDVDYDQR
ncbi:MAG TPA: hypothetical protein VGV14_11740 [Rhodanobacter sp.]|nr:hypothetical protein [Rhodanobacter sp.]